MNRLVQSTLLLLLSLGTLKAEPQAETWVYLDNGKLRLGVNRSAGGVLGWLSESGFTTNYLDHYDLGRYVQQSWYGDADGSDWNGKPWRWNPVQGGDWRGTAAKVLEFDASAESITTTSVPRHWATGEAIDTVSLKQEISLDGPLIRITFSMRYSGEKAHAPRHQELPAVFVNPAFANLHFLSAKDGTHQVVIPGWPNQQHAIRDGWVAYLDDSQYGIGILTPIADRVTCYRAEGDPNNRNKAACSYVAPIKSIAVEPGFEFRYNVYLTIGSLEQIQRRFGAVRAEL